MVSLKWWALEDCLARSRLTAIPYFAAIFHISQNTPASAHSRRTSEKDSRYQNNKIKKTITKVIVFFMVERKRWIPNLFIQVQI